MSVLDIVLVVLVLLTSVVLSEQLTRYIPVPLPLMQIALGIVVGFSSDLKITLNPDVFFLIFLPPLLFLDGWRIPKEALLRNIRTITSLAFGLVVFTVLGGGLFIHWLIPAVPLPLSFALAAILSPTDPIAVASIAKRTPIPGRLMTILEGEALFNDASGLVCMRFAVAAVMTGLFSLEKAVFVFSWLVCGGIIIGATVTFLIIRARSWLHLDRNEKSGIQILVSLLIPFIAYLVAEYVKGSGILAAVIAGTVMSRHEHELHVLSETRIESDSVWNTIQIAANGAIFILLGEQLPDIIGKAAEAVHESGHFRLIWLLVYILSVYGILSLLRFIWVWTSLRMTLFRQTGLNDQYRHYRWKVVLVMTIAGARGAVTLAGILTLPFLLPDGKLFPARDLVIWIAAGVIICSLLTASATLPWLLKNLEFLHESKELSQLEIMLRRRAAIAALQAIEQTRQNMSGENNPNSDLYIAAAEHVSAPYRRRLERSDDETGDQRLHRLEEIEKILTLSGIRAERDTLYAAQKTHHLPENLMHKLIRELDYYERALSDTDE